MIAQEQNDFLFAFTVNRLYKFNCTYTTIRALHVYDIFSLAIFLEEKLENVFLNLIPS